ncbi:acyl-CoA dehydrogenase family protein [Sphingomonas sp. SUN019]|uniref:acyl-CoA dehydrogenase family protein n=1 Tax=Sphingomonas sp. SUN019 TaxID=2937788 RepID=UPI002164C2F7|nr:acyl-CoA dehydrogenase family protein [Sphingomonas sp. SUN019]UVO51763.1 acyl-CoA dehydrogenase family protein [Sphingomonas sp. SUN019]
MDFEDSPHEAAYRATARDWLATNVAEHKAPSHADDMAAARSWQARKAAAGYAQITWPKEWGGGGGTPIEGVIFGQEEAKHPVQYGYFSIGLGMCVPTVMAFANDDTKQRFVGPALRGEEIWSQLFSEPAGGSDVAAIRTRAIRDGDDWVVNGQKVWTSGAHYSDFGIVLVRTNPDVPKHKGLTMFWLDLRSPGIEIRPIHQMSGGSNFNEVYFTDVRIPDSQRLGDVDSGWKVALVTLMNERLAIGGGGGAGPADILRAARELDGADGPLIKDSAFRQRLADWHVQTEGLRNTRMRTMTALSRGQTPGPESSIGKIIAANQLQDIGNAAVEAEDQYGIINDPALLPLKGLFQSAVMNAPGLRIAGGTDEILKNIIAERVLGLPGEIRVDKDDAFKDLPVGR